MAETAIWVAGIALVGTVISVGGTVFNFMYTRATSLKVEGYKSELTWGLNSQQSRLGIAAQMELKLYEKSLDSYARTRAAFAESGRLIGDYVAVLEGDVDRATAHARYDAALRMCNEARTGCILVPESCRPKVRALLEANSDAVYHLYQLHLARDMPHAERWAKAVSILRERDKSVEQARATFDAWQDVVEGKPRELLLELQRPPSATLPEGPQPPRRWWRLFSRPPAAVLPPASATPPRALLKPPETGGLLFPAREYSALRGVPQVNPLRVRHGLVKVGRG
jgi:hypothetical protein